MRKVLYVSTEGTEREEEKIIKELQDKGYAVINYAGEFLFENVRQVLEDDFFYFVFSFEFYTMLSKACVATGTKYVTWICPEYKESPNVANVGVSVNYIFVSEPLVYERVKAQGGRVFYIQEGEDAGVSIEKVLFEERERTIYEIINQLAVLKNNYRGKEILFKHLKDINKPEELVQRTDIFFDRMEEESDLNFSLKMEVSEYIDTLLQRRNFEAWRELILWNNRYGTKELKNTFWEFYILWKVMSIYVEEMQEYIERGYIPSVVQFGCMEEMTTAYFQTLFLLRRLEYDIAPEEEGQVISYIVGKNLSGIFLRHIINETQIDNKEKVCMRIEELLAKYEQ